MKEDPTKIKLQTNVKKEADPTLIRMSGTAVHGNTPFDVPFISEIAPNLWQGGCQTGLQLPHFFKHIVSVYPWEAYKINHDIDSAVYVKMYDSLEQGLDDIITLAKWVNLKRKTGPVLVHCQAGLNRSSTVVATALMLEGLSGKEAVELIRKQRSPASLCNPTFEKWVLDEEYKNA
jgi:protein-tyrosine phosphatase